MSLFTVVAEGVFVAFRVYLIVVGMFKANVYAKGFFFRGHIFGFVCAFG